jgi:hypothetical protein
VSKVISFIKSRPTEVWLGLWTAAVAVLLAAGIEVPPGVVAAVSAVIGWLVTFVASRDSNSLGPS